MTVTATMCACGHDETRHAETEGTRVYCLVPGCRCLHLRRPARTPVPAAAGARPGAANKDVAVRRREGRERSHGLGAGPDPANKDVAVAKVGSLISAFELRQSPAGKTFARARLVVETPRTSGDWRGEKRRTSYDVVCFGSLAENTAACLSKGTRVVVLGRGQVRTWTGQDGVEHSEKEIVAEAIGPDLRFSTVAIESARLREPTMSESAGPSRR